MPSHLTDEDPQPEGTAAEVLFAFLRLGCLSFGGPIAHLGYFHTEFVERRRWCTEETFGELVALAQSLPGPASSQVAFALGLLRGGFAGAAAAWVGFTLPSALLMIAFAFGHTLLTGSMGAGVLHGLQIVAVAIVAQAIVTMQRTLAPDAPRVTIAAAAAAIALFAPASAATLLAILLGALLGAFLPTLSYSATRESPTMVVTRRRGLVAAILFLTLLIIPPALAINSRSTSLTPSTAPAPSSSAAATSSFRCSNTPSSRPAGSISIPSSAAMAQPRPSPARSLPSQPFSARPSTPAPIRCCSQ